MAKNRGSSKSNHETDLAFLNYTIPRDFDIPQSPSFSMGKSRRLESPSSPTPSPQEVHKILTQYNLPNNYKNTPSAHLDTGKGPKEPKPDLGPGPAQYHPPSPKSPIKYSIPKSKSSSVLSVDRSIPGVGKYEQKLLEMAKSTVFSKAKRMLTVAKEDSVGVGTYNVNDQGIKYYYSIPRAGAKNSCKVWVWYFNVCPNYWELFRSVLIIINELKNQTRKRKQYESILFFWVGRWVNCQIIPNLLSLRKSQKRTSVLYLWYSIRVSKIGVEKCWYLPLWTENREGKVFRSFFRLEFG